MKRFEVITKLCKHCQQPLITTSKRELVHAQCRQEYYSAYHAKRIGYIPINTTRNRSKFYVNDQPCAACGYILLTKPRKYWNALALKKETINLCSNCIAEIRCGYLEAGTWKKKDTTIAPPGC